MKKIIYSFLCLGLIVAFDVQAEDTEDPCTVKGGGAMAANMCQQKDLDLADKNLNIEYQKAITRIKEEQKYIGRNLEEKFRESQRAWLKYRDSHCEFEGESTGAEGGWSGIHISNCVLEMNKERTEYFTKVFNG